MLPQCAIWTAWIVLLGAAPVHAQLGAVLAEVGPINLAHRLGLAAGLTDKAPRADDRDHLVELLALRLAIPLQPLPLLWR